LGQFDPQGEDGEECSDQRRLVTKARSTHYLIHKQWRLYSKTDFATIWYLMQSLLFINRWRPRCWLFPGCQAHHDPEKHTRSNVF